MDYANVMTCIAGIVVLSTKVGAMNVVFGAVGHPTWTVKVACGMHIGMSLEHAHVIPTGVMKTAVYMRDSVILNVRTDASDQLTPIA